MSNADLSTTTSRRTRRRHNAGTACTSSMMTTAALAAVLAGIAQTPVHSFSLQNLPARPTTTSRPTSATGTATNQQLHMYKDFVDDAEHQTANSNGQSASSFEQRMRDRFMKNSAAPIKDLRRRNGASALPPNVQYCDTLKDYKAAVTKNMDGMLVVRFYAKWCQSCKKIAPAYYKLAKLNPDVTFLDVPTTEENINLHQGLGVPSIPYSFIYYKGVLVEEVKLSRKRFPAFAAKVKMYDRGTCECTDEEGCATPFADGSEEGAGEL
mmetsp:Transcript_28094/g.56956  ORF Transcript_28094/g.56956 Transcript_28094/m.56956 type:complete len:267 (+) Transcript_28094:1603-2403(+)